MLAAAVPVQRCVLLAAPECVKHACLSVVPFKLRHPHAAVLHMARHLCADCWVSSGVIMMRQA